MKHEWMRQREQQAADLQFNRNDDDESVRADMDFGHFSAIVDRATPFELAEMSRVLAEKLGTMFVGRGR
jgi:hypothetical protein